MFGAGETVTVTRLGAPASGHDDLGNPTLAASSEFDVDDVGIAPITPNEATEMWGPDNKGGYSLFMPYGTELVASDVVTVRGESGFQVQGAADLVQWRNPFTGWEAGAVAVVKRGS
jgi:hypothetical protein